MCEYDYELDPDYEEGETTKLKTNLVQIDKDYEEICQMLARGNVQRIVRYENKTSEDEWRAECNASIGKLFDALEEYVHNRVCHAVKKYIASAKKAA